VRQVITTTLDRGRAERFASLLEGRANHSGSEQLAALVAVGSTLRRLPLNGDIDPEFRDRLRGRLLAVATVRPAVEPGVREPGAREPGPREPVTAGRRGRRLPRRAAVLGGVVLSLMTVCGVVTASTGAVPGSPLYGIKQATESAQLALTGSESARGELQLGFARTRLGEARKIHGNQGQLLTTLGDMDRSTRYGSRLLTGVAVGDQDRAPLDAIDAFIHRQRPGVVALLPTVRDPRSHAAAASSLGLLDRLRTRVSDLRSTLHCPATGQPATDDLGPLPGTCAAQSRAPAGSIAPRGQGVDPNASGPASARLNVPAVPEGPVPAPPIRPEDSREPDLPLPSLPSLTGTVVLPPLPGTVVLPPLPGTTPHRAPRGSRDVGSLIQHLLDDVLGSIGVSAPPFTLPPLRSPGNN
jgi:hypothetical protein